MDTMVWSMKVMATAKIIAARIRNFLLPALGRCHLRCPLLPWTARAAVPVVHLAPDASKAPAAGILPPARLDPGLLPGPRRLLAAFSLGSSGRSAGRRVATRSLGVQAPGRG